MVGLLVIGIQVERPATFSDRPLVWKVIGVAPEASPARGVGVRQFRVEGDRFFGRYEGFFRPLRVVSGEEKALAMVRPRQVCPGHGEVGASANGALEHPD